MAKKPVSLGKRVKDFVRESSRGGKVNTASFRDKKILLSFHPLAWTSVCGRQMQALDAAYPELEKLKTVPLGISVDSAPSKAAWAKVLRLKKLHLLADFWPHGETAKKLGVFDKKGGNSLRANIILGKKRKVIFCRVYPVSQLPDLKEVLLFLKKKAAHEAEGSGKIPAAKIKAKKSTMIKPAAKKPAETPKALPAEKPADKPADKPPEA